MNPVFQSYQEKMRQIADVGYAVAVLHWDQETYMPKKGAEHRAQQIATLAGIAHDMSTSPELGEILGKLANDTTLDPWQARNISESQQSYKKKGKLSTDFVRRQSLATSNAFQAWLKAREANSYVIFEPQLAAMVALQREKAAMLGYEAHPYDALVDEFEPGMKTAALDVLFGDVRRQLVAFLRPIAECAPPDDTFLYRQYDKDKQWQFGIDLLKQMGYDFEAGRQDISTHPFTTNFSSLDVRVTTRINERNFNEMTWSCIHEGGHALYEQGLNPEYYGLPTGEYLSLGIHESQSRLWENNVGRSLFYWKANYPSLQKLFPESLSDVSAHQFYAAINKVQPSLIRTNADELTYHFHILIRFEIEKGLIEGSIDTRNLSEVWNTKYKEYLGIDVPSDKQGVLQDIHWSHGSFGYFPTYSLGSFYAAQFFRQACKDMPTLIGDIENGNMLPLLAWLREKVHRFGKFYNSEQLCQEITGEPLRFSYFMDYAREKYGNLYGIV